MDRVAKNLRLFFGYDAAQVWSQLRDIQRAERSVDIYRQIIVELEKDLNDEENKRGRLVLLRSNELTDVKNDLKKTEKEHKELFRKVLESEAKVENWLECLKTFTLSFFGKSKSVEQIKDDLQKDSTQLTKVDAQLKGLMENFGEAIFKQTAAMDPIRDLKFAIGHLKQEIRSCQKRKALIESTLLSRLKEMCQNSSPVEIQLLFDMGLQVKNPEKFSELYLEIGSYFDADVKEILPDKSRQDLMHSAVNGIYTKANPFSCNLLIEGEGYHHRKVKSGDSTKWKKRDVNFSGHINVNAKLRQTHWNSHSSSETMVKIIEKDYLTGRGKASAKREENSNAKKTALQSSAKELLSMLI